MALTTLNAMAKGGIHDALGGGFHRYSTDAAWLVPHFEKMLYDQAQLASLYVEAYQLTNDPHFATVARDVLDYVLRELTGPSGEFFSAEDADSAVDPADPDRKAEGAFYTWAAADIDKVLGPEAAALFAFRYGVASFGNTGPDAREALAGRNILHVGHPMEETAAKFALEPVEAERRLTLSARRLLVARAGRLRPMRDDKAIVAWNGLMISAFAKAGAALGEPRYTAAATRAADFIRTQALDVKSGRLARSVRGGQIGGVGFLADYACYIRSLLDLYQATLSPGWLRLAVDLQKRQDERFWRPGEAISPATRRTRT